MGGMAAPDDWQGGLNFTYNIGPGFVEDKQNWYKHLSHAQT